MSVKLDRQKERLSRWTAEAQRMFAEHRVTLSPDVPAMRWAAPDTMICGIEYFLFGGTLFVRGDFGTAVYQWSSPLSFQTIGTFGFDYFSEKVDARDPLYNRHAEMVRHRQWLHWYGLALAAKQIPDDYVTPTPTLFSRPAQGTTP